MPKIPGVVTFGSVWQQASENGVASDTPWGDGGVDEDKDEALDKDADLDLDNRDADEEDDDDDSVDDLDSCDEGWLWWDNELWGSV